MSEDENGRWVIPDDMDPECVDVCVALNNLPGVKTESSCAGHGEDRYAIWLKVDALENLQTIVAAAARMNADKWHWQFAVNLYEWSHVCFVLYGPGWEDAAEQSERLAAALKDSKKNSLDDRRGAG